ncbi:MAG: helix-hairpin-helix domain-containing protein [Chlamydiales bacterium]|nr:helix-hairpin-helix domain-containing protein [Chlamydiales bacterium]
MDKHQVAMILADMAILLELQGESTFKVRAYRKASRAIEDFVENLELVVAQDGLKNIPGIGDHIGRMIKALVRTGHLPYYEELKQATPAVALQLLKIRSLGPKKVQQILSTLPIKNAEDLMAACQQGDIARLPGLGLKAKSISWKASLFWTSTADACCGGMRG